MIAIQHSFKDVFKNQNDINNQINKQIHINDELIGRLAAVQNFTVTNINQIKIEVNSVKSKVATNTATILLDFHFQKFNYVIDHLTLHIKEIQEILQLSRHQIISKHLLTPEELKYIVDILVQQIIRMEHEISLYNLVKLKSYYNQTKIIYW